MRNRKEKTPIYKLQMLLQRESVEESLREQENREERENREQEIVGRIEVEWENKRT